MISSTVTCQTCFLRLRLSVNIQWSTKTGTLPTIGNDEIITVSSAYRRQLTPPVIYLQLSAASESLFHYDAARDSHHLQVFDSRGLCLVYV